MVTESGDKSTHRDYGVVILVIAIVFIGMNLYYAIDLFTVTYALELFSIIY